MATELIKPALAADYTKERAKGSLRYPYYAQPKIDGVRVLAAMAEGEVRLYSRNGKVFNLPHIAAALNPFLSANPQIILDGELYSRDLSFTALCSAIRSSDNNDKSKVRLYLFDAFNADKQRQAYRERYKTLSALLGVAFIEVVETITVKSNKSVEDALERFTGAGYEGVMIKEIKAPYKQGRSNAVMKYKKFCDAEFTVREISENTIICYTAEGVAFSVLGKAEIGEIVTIRYQEKTEKGSLRFPRLISSRDYE